MSERLIMALTEAMANAGASIEHDLDGQIVVYTGIYTDQDGNPIDVPPRCRCYWHIGEDEEPEICVFDTDSKWLDCAYAKKHRIGKKENCVHYKETL